MSSIKDYISIARADHWFKNVFILPGAMIAAFFTKTHISEFWLPLVTGLMSACLVASANYVINEWLDARFDQFHPVKKNRPAVKRQLSARIVYAEYALLLAVGIFLASTISREFFLVSILFAVMGFLYNVEPFRTKDKVYLDVLSESVNNPIRLCLGWFMVVQQPLPPSSLILGYWMGGAYLMGIKRYAELRFIGKNDDSEKYRRSFRSYTEKKLLISSFFYAMCAAFFLGVFLVKCRIELLLGLPLFAGLFVWYLDIGMRHNSPVQQPERLYKDKAFFCYCVLFGLFISALLFIDIPWIHWFLNSDFSN